eukprot:450176_1
MIQIVMVKTKPRQHIIQIKVKNDHQVGNHQILQAIFQPCQTVLLFNHHNHSYNQMQKRILQKKATYCIYNFHEKCNLISKTKQSPTKCSEKEIERAVSDYTGSDSDAESEDEQSDNNSKKRTKSFKYNSPKKKRKINGGENYDSSYNKIMKEMNKFKTNAEKSGSNYQKQIKALNAEKNDLIRTNILLKKDLE